MQPASASAVIATMTEYRNARATRTGAIPHNETAPVLHRLWLINGFARARARLTAFFTLLRRAPLPEERRGSRCVRARAQALTPEPIGQDTPVPPSPQ